MPVERGAADIPIELKPRGGWGGGVETGSFSDKM